MFWKKENTKYKNHVWQSNFFHALRRQMTWPFRKPLINLSPKANLRHPGSYSSSDDFTNGSFKELIDDENSQKSAKKVILCSGKIYFDLNEYRLQNKIDDTAIVRLEQLYPLPVSQLEALKKKYSKATWLWVQEEPLNMGAASYLKMNLDLLPFRIVARNASAATATGYNKIHLKEQQELLKQAFA